MLSRIRRLKNRTQFQCTMLILCYPNVTMDIIYYHKKCCIDVNSFLCAFSRMDSKYLPNKG